MCCGGRALEGHAPAAVSGDAVPVYYSPGVRTPKAVRRTRATDGLPPWASGRAAEFVSAGRRTGPGAHHLRDLAPHVRTPSGRGAPPPPPWGCGGVHRQVQWGLQW